MALQRVHIKPGMILYNTTRDDAGIRYRITRVSGSVAFYEGLLGKESIFCVGVDKDGYANIGDIWILEYSKSLPRECKCGIFRGDCTYHKDQ